HTLYHKEDLPFPIKDIPDTFAQFRKKVEKESFVRPIFPKIERLTTHPHLEQTSIPSLEDLGFILPEINTAHYTTPSLIGGEEHGLTWLNKTLSSTYNEADDYNVVSPYIAHGNISPAYYYQKIKE